MSAAAVLRRVAVDAFERVAFLMPEPEDQEVPAGEMRAAVRVAYQGPFRGALDLRADETLLATLATNMLGLDQAPPMATQMDALGELANVLCGNALPALHGALQEFRLSAPMPVGLVGRGAPAWAAPDRSAEVRIALDGGIAEVVLWEQSRS